MGENHQALEPRVLSPQAVRDLGALVASSAYFADAREAAQAAVKIMAGAELGLGPIASMRGIDIIKGEVTLSAGAVAALVRRSGVYDYRIKQWDESGCSIVFTRMGEVLMPVSSFGPEEARRAGLDGGVNYKRYARNMYFARAMTNGARLHCPDLFVGSVYTPDELAAVDVSESVYTELDPGVPPGPENASEGTPGASTGFPADASPAVEEAEVVAVLKQRLSVAMEEGMGGGQLRQIMDGLGIAAVIEPGWVSRLSPAEAERLAAHLAAIRLEPDPEDIAF